MIIALVLMVLFSLMPNSLHAMTASITESMDRRSYSSNWHWIQIQCKVVVLDFKNLTDIIVIVVVAVALLINWLFQWNCLRSYYKIYIQIQKLLLLKIKNMNWMSILNSITLKYAHDYGPIAFNLNRLQIKLTNGIFDMIWFW